MFGAYANSSYESLNWGIPPPFFPTLPSPGQFLYLDTLRLLLRPFLVLTATCLVIHGNTREHQARPSINIAFHVICCPPISESTLLGQLHQSMSNNCELEHPCKSRLNPYCKSKRYFSLTILITANIGALTSSSARIGTAVAPLAPLVHTPITMIYKTKLVNQLNTKKPCSYAWTQYF